ncbi:tyrosine-protein phosphatase [Pseudalkalibacillus berkeleyi]|uniref:Tyrosine-protein phosphatase n=1 Tax=Pseudalkalibacillus berkeleyi TaxID=1069813 RepID=A0ABS9H4I9_9BACL|nr:CpsB/CapC family capsule biosynthesis tyrosine phosphatase [Pseudalkalibacillus berkeleyi]MCF6138831.1 tyrosine protein phosphatase [Pseudalkalibacillus berkeleyi]
MIDIHCHILPGIDDGASQYEDSMNMAKKAIEEGITTIIATPHHNHHFPNHGLEIENHVARLNEKLKENHIEIEVIQGQEPRITADFIEELNRGEILTLGNQRKYVHIELPSNQVPRHTKSIIFELQLMGITPIIVHPERNTKLTENPDLLFELVNEGALTQVTAASVVGNFGKNIQKFSYQIIEHNLSHFIASDAHNISNRSFHLRGAYEAIEKKFGIKKRYELQENPALLINGESITASTPEPIKRRKILGLF